MYISDKVHIRLNEKIYKVLMKEIKEANNQRAILCSWIGKLNIVKMSVLPNLIYIFNAIPKNPSYFIHTDKLILMFIWNYGQKCFHGLKTCIGIPTFSLFVSVSLSIYLPINHLLHSKWNSHKIHIMPTLYYTLLYYTLLCLHIFQILQLFILTYNTYVSGGDQKITLGQVHLYPLDSVKNAHMWRFNHKTFML